jgi:hypothetical protein
LAAQTGYAGNSTKRSIIGDDLYLPYADWNGNVGFYGGTRVFINSLVLENGFTQVVGSPTRGDRLLDVYLVRSESLFTSGGIVQWISDNYRVIEWKESCCVPQVERLVPEYHTTDVLGLQTFLLYKFAIWASNVKCVEEMWKNIKEIVYESIESFVPHKLLRENPDPECYNGEFE